MTRPPGGNSFNPIRLRRFVAALAIGWTVCVAVSLFWNLHQTEQKIHEVALTTPRRSALWLGHGLLWLTGLTGLGLGNRRLGAQIREQEAAEQALVESEKRFRSIFENAGAGMNTVTLEGRFLQTNNAFRDFIGYSESELQALTVFDLTFAEDTERTRSLFDEVRCGQRKAFNYEKRFVRKDGETVWGAVTAAWQFDVRGTPLYAVGLVQDVTELRALENQLRHAQKMEAIGTLTAGIAHDFNNILTAIVGHASLLEMKMDAMEPLRSHVLQILTASDRAAQLTRSLLAFSRKQSFEPSLCDLNELLKRSGKMLARLLRADIDLHITPAASAVTVMADGGQLEQVVMNLVTNARDAMPQGGTLYIRVRRVDLDASFVQTHGFGIPGDYSLIEVSDTGAGMDEATRQRVFEPFFTTKPTGKGTGLGMAIVYGIVKQHSGYINCCSEQGKGSTFRIYLPAAAEKPEVLSPG